MFFLAVEGRTVFSILSRIAQPNIEIAATVFYYVNRLSGIAQLESMNFLIIKYHLVLTDSDLSDQIKPVLEGDYSKCIPPHIGTFAKFHQPVSVSAI